MSMLFAPGATVVRNSDSEDCATVRDAQLGGRIELENEFGKRFFSNVRFWHPRCQLSIEDAMTRIVEWRAA